MHTQREAASETQPRRHSGAMQHLNQETVLAKEDSITPAQPEKNRSGADGTRKLNRYSTMGAIRRRRSAAKEMLHSFPE